jgi:hypothetical protein
VAELRRKRTKLSVLCCTIGMPMLSRRQGFSVTDAQDLTQEFFAVSQHTLNAPIRAGDHTFCSLFKNFLANQYRGQTVKR